MPGEPLSEPRALERYADELRRMARVRLGHQLRGRLDPSDLVQQTLLVGYARRDQFRGTTHAELRRWLRTILARTLAQAARRINRFRPERAWSLEGSIDHPSSRPGLCLAADASTPSHRAVRGEQLELLAAAISALPDDQRTALELHHFHNLSVADVAARMDRTVAAVAGLLYRGGKALRGLLEPL